jgi:hypothetical protein
MPSITNVFFFRDLLTRAGRAASAASDELWELDRAMVLDSAERLAHEPHTRVTVYDMEGSEEGAGAAEGCSFVIQHHIPAASRVEETGRSFYERNEGGKLVVLLGRNPLYGLTEIARAAVLLDQEDEAVVYAAGGTDGEARVALVATRRFHPGLYALPDPGLPGLSLRAVVAAEAMVLPLRPMRTVRGPADFAWLMHEVEREVLLGHWFPRRTYDLLRMMKRRRSIPESL